jgi:circadian clock protein KaiB
MPMTKPPRSRARRSTHVLRLFVSRPSEKSERAVENLERVCEEHLKGRYDLVVIDISKQAQLARDAQIVAVPTLIKYLPLPFQRLVGDMSDLSQVLVGLDLRLRRHT